jgi:hypothetical protein
MAILLVSFLWGVLRPAPTLGLSSVDSVRLKKAGLSAETIGVLMEEKTIETCAFTIQDILDLKQAGIAEDTIRRLIRDASFMKDTEPVIYGREMRRVQFTTVQDIIALKQAGISDEVLRTLLTVASGTTDDREREKAWEMLRSMGIILDPGKE